MSLLNMRGAGTETPAGAQAKADAAEAAAIAASVQSVVAGTNVTVDDTDPNNPIVSASGSGGATYYTILVDAAGGGDYTTISAALAAASAGDAIFIRNGTYAGGVTISLDGITMIGESREGVIIQSPVATTPAITVSGARVTLRDLKVDGLRDSQTGAGTGDVGNQSFSGIYVTGTDFLAENIWVFEPRGMGITGASGSHRGRILNSRIENRATNGTTPVAGAYSYGVLVTNTNSRWKIAYNTITGWSQGVGLWFGANECVVEVNDIIDNYGYLDEAHTISRSAVEDYGATATTHGKNIWDSNVIDGTFGSCIECASGVVGSQYVANILKNYDGNAGGSHAIIAVGSALEPTEDITFESNRVYGVAGSAGVGIYTTVSGVIVNLNKFFDFTNSAITTGTIFVDGPLSTAANITNNTIKNCRGGVYIGGGIADGAIISRNRIEEPASTTTAININGGRAHSINENYIDGNTVSLTAISIANTAGDGHRIVSNTIKNIASTGIDCRRGYSQIQSNDIQTTNVFGAIRLDGATAIYNNVRWNHCNANNNTRTIYLTNSAANNIIQENILVGASAIVIYDSTAWPTTNNNVSTPNHKSTLTVPITGRSLGGQTVGTSEATIAHGLPWTPREVRIVMTSAGTIWQSTAADGTNIYLTADAAGRTCNVVVV